jgi:uncharacterized protein YoxC
VIKDTDAMLATLNDLAAPDVPEGEQRVSTVIDALTGLRTSFKDLRDQSADLPTASPEAFTTQFQTLLTKFQSDVGSLGESLNQFQSDELDSAFSAAPACDPLQ